MQPLVANPNTAIDAIITTMRRGLPESWSHDGRNSQFLVMSRRSTSVREPNPSGPSKRRTGPAPDSTSFSHHKAGPSLAPCVTIGICICVVHPGHV